MKRERDKPPIAMLARDGRHVGNAFITLPSLSRERLWRRVEDSTAAPPAPHVRKKGAGGAEWVRPGIVAAPSACSLH